MSTALQPPPVTQLAEGESPGQIKLRVQAIQQLMAEVLKPGTKDNEWSGDYGIIPGTGKKPSLWKSGSEQILAMFQIAVDPMVEDLSSEDCFRYRVTTRLTHAPSGQFLGAGVGEASSDETKYKWRRTYSQKEYEATPVDRRRVKFSQYKDGNGMWADKEELQVRQDPADIANTILKMAKKRSQIDATLTVTGASSMFDQDLEDLPEQQREEPKKRGRKGTAPANTDVMCTDCRAINGHLPSCKHAKKQEAAPPDEKQATTAPTLTKALFLILTIDSLLKKPDKDGKQEPYLRLNVVNQANEESVLFVWHKSLHEHLAGKIDKPLLCEFSTGKRVDGSAYRSLENILELAGVKYADNKPSAEDDF